MRDSDGCTEVHSNGKFSVWQRPLKPDKPPIYEVREQGFTHAKVVSVMALAEGGFDRAVRDCDDRAARHGLPAV